MRMRRLILTAVLSLVLIAPAAAQATSITSSAGGVRATLSYTGGPGITTRNERLTISRGGRVVYDQPVPSHGCFRVCGPGSRHPVAVRSLYGDDAQDVVLTLWNGGADCCTLADVYVPSAAVHSYVLDQHNFGEAGFVLRNIGPRGRPEFVSADPAFYCQFTDCAASGLPLQIFEFDQERFVNVTRLHPALIRRDAASWLRVYRRHPTQGQGVIAAWIGDEENVHASAAISSEITLLERRNQITPGFVAHVARVLRAHHYATGGL